MNLQDSDAAFKRPVVLYLAGSGRSGSTLLELLLERYQSVASVGELHLLPHELQFATLGCSCGASVQDCRVWSVVLSRCKAQAMGLTAFREQHTGGRVLRPVELAILSLYRIGHSSRLPAVGAMMKGFHRRLEHYARDSEKVLESFLQTIEEARNGARPKIIVDSSKDPYRLMALSLGGSADIRVVHVIKDPRAYVYSRLSRPGSDSAKTRGPVALLRSLRFAASWISVNLVTTSVLKVTGVPCIIVWYDELTEEPLPWTEAALRLAGGSPQCSAAKPESHAIGGNPMRNTFTGVIRDQRWIGQKDQFALRVVAWVCRPIATYLRASSPGSCSANWGKV